MARIKLTIDIADDAADLPYEDLFEGLQSLLEVDDTSHIEILEMKVVR